MLLKIIDINSTMNFIGFTEAETGYECSFSKEDLIKAMEHLRFWNQSTKADNFSSQLFNLICKADLNNQVKIMKGFPAETLAYFLWFTSENPHQTIDYYTSEQFYVRKSS